VRAELAGHPANPGIQQAEYVELPIAQPGPARQAHYVSESTANASRIRVWDPLVRVGHWLIVVGFFVAYLTEDDLLSAHVWAGYVVGAVVVVRVLWGFVGSRYARFSDFLYGPKEAWRYLGELIRGRGRRFLGHSPAGGVMVILLLLGLAATTWSGLMVYAYDQGAGPLADMVALPARGTRAEDEDHDFEESEDFWEETHEVFANLTLLLIAFHIGGVLLASFVHRENLVAAMLTGDKRELDEDH